MKIDSWGGSRMGANRSENQDSHGTDPAQGLYILSDGMGGHAEGARASQEVVRSLLNGRGESGTRVSSPARSLQLSVFWVHERVVSLARKMGHEGDMGATLVCLSLDGASYRLATVGDSRGHLWRDDRLMVLNEDHTLVQQYLQQGIITGEEVEAHPQRHVLTQAMGVGDIQPDLFEGQTAPGDRFLLTSDGVHGVVSLPELAEIMGHAPTPREAGQSLLDLVEQRKGHDDATVVVVHLTE